MYSQRPCVALQAAQFCRGAEFVSAQQTTVSSGIADLLLGADIDEFVFEPCGYSMNGLQVGPSTPLTSQLCHGLVAAIFSRTNPLPLH